VDRDPLGLRRRQGHEGRLTNLTAIEYNPSMKEDKLEVTITRQVNRHAVEAAADAAVDQMAREGISIYEQTPEQRARVQAIREHLDAQYADADLAESLLSKMANVSRGDAFVDLLSREHPYLLNEIAWMVLKAVSTRIARSDGLVDGRISPNLAEFATQFAAPLKGAR